MNIKITVALVLWTLTATVAFASDIYRWTDPNTGKLVTTVTAPPYPVIEQRPGGRLPNGNVIDLVIDLNAPEVKAAVAKRNAREAEQKRIAEEQARQRFAQEEEAIRIAAERKAETEKKLREEAAAREKEQERTTAEPEKPRRSIVAKPASTQIDADSIVTLINAMYGKVCHAEISGIFSKTLKLDWTANTKKIHFIKIMAEIAGVKAQLYESGVRYLQFPNDAGTYNIIDWKTGEKTSNSERAPYYFTN